MKSNYVKHALAAGEPQIGTWLSLASLYATRYIARSGLHWYTVDMEHSAANWNDAAAMFGAIAEAGAVPLCRIPGNTVENVKRALDCGAFGIVFPMVNSKEEAELCVSACKYPPVGVRSIGGGLHALNFGCAPGEYYKKANDEILIIIQAEHVLAVERCEEILSVPGIDAVFIGPNDLLSSMHKTPAMETDDPQFVAALKHIRETAVKCGVAPGLHTANAEMAKRRIAEGWKFVAVGSELAFMMDGVKPVAEICKGNSGGEGVSRY
ncbi:MAG: aldolase/citrate lyase family protein [Chthonomonadales bacterium]